MQKQFIVFLALHKHSDVVIQNFFWLAETEEEALDSVLKNEKILGFLKQGYQISHHRTEALDPDVCPQNSDFNVYYLGSAKMLCIRTDALSAESVESILSATNLSEIERANFLPRIATKEKQ